MNEKETQSILKSRIKSFSHAFRGLRLFLKTQPNAQIQLIAIILITVLGFHYSVGRFEWIALVFAMGFVVTSEAINTAIEIDIDLTSPEYHPYARDTKDVAAGMVLLASIVACIVGCIVFFPYIW